MISLPKKIQALTVLLVLFMGMSLILPPGMDLELCFGNDGHIGLSLNGHQDDTLPCNPSKEQKLLYETAYPDNCQHVALLCGTEQKLNSRDIKTDLSKYELKQDPSKAPILFSNTFVSSSGTNPNSNPYPVFFEDFPSLHLISLRTVVLLI